MRLELRWYDSLKIGIVNRDSSGIEPPILVAQFPKKQELWTAIPRESRNPILVAQFPKNRNCKPGFLRNRATSSLECAPAFNQWSKFIRVPRSEIESVLKWLFIFYILAFVKTRTYVQSFSISSQMITLLLPREIWRNITTSRGASYMVLNELGVDSEGVLAGKMAWDSFSILL